MFSFSNSHFFNSTKCFVYGASVQGLSHKEIQKECQDYNGFKQVKSKGGKNYVIAGVADGVGAYMNSAMGAKVAIETAINYIEKSLVQNKSSKWDLEIILPILESSFDKAYDSVINVADERGYSPLTLATTLSVIVYDGEHACFGHIGDSGIVALYSNGTIELVTSKNRDAHSQIVSTLLNPKENWEFIGLDQSISALFLMTDGILETYVVNGNVYWPSFQAYLVDRKLVRKSEDVSAELAKFLGSDQISNFVKDDISLVVVQNISEDLPDVDFDEETFKTKICYKIPEDELYKISEDEPAVNDVTKNDNVEENISSTIQKTK